jgi:hypothetical protein
MRPHSLLRHRRNCVVKHPLPPANSIVEQLLFDILRKEPFHNYKISESKLNVPFLLIALFRCAKQSASVTSVIPALLRGSAQTRDCGSLPPALRRGPDGSRHRARLAICPRQARPRGRRRHGTPIRGRREHARRHLAFCSAPLGKSPMRLKTAGSRLSR